MRPRGGTVSPPRALAIASGPPRLSESTTAAPQMPQNESDPARRSKGLPLGSGLLAAVDWHETDDL